MDDCLFLESLGIRDVFFFSLWSFLAIIGIAIEAEGNEEKFLRSSG